MKFSGKKTVDNQPRQRKNCFFKQEQKSRSQRVILSMSSNFIFRLPLFLIHIQLTVLLILQSHAILSFSVLMTQESNNPFGAVEGMLNNPLTQYGLGQLKGAIPFDKYSGILTKVFTPQIRAYFDVNTQLVRKKLIKLIIPFKTFQWDDQIKKLQLYIPLISLTTLILFSTIVQGISTQHFQPKMGKKMLWIILLSFTEVVIAKCTENVISNLNIGYLELSSLVSYRFVPLSLLSIILTITNLSIPYLNLIGLAYLLITDTYFCKLQLSGYARDMFKEDGLGSKIALLVHFFITLTISWICDII